MGLSIIGLYYLILPKSINDDLLNYGDIVNNIDNEVKSNDSEANKVDGDTKSVNGEVLSCDSIVNNIDNEVKSIDGEANNVDGDTESINDEAL